ncbi:MAG: SRPBCC family protein [Bacteroidota bacterium]
MKVYKLVTEQFLPVSINVAWDFFSRPENLSEITPEDMNFIITSGDQEKMYPGMIVTYKVHPLFGIPLTWVTEITQVREPHYFIDEQRAGPYKFWHHQHIFEEKDGGVNMRDIVHYGLPFGFIGNLIHPLVVKRKLNDIFEFREKKVDQIFKTG